MGADDFYDAVGKVLSYILSAEDSIDGQRKWGNGQIFIVRRNNTDLTLYAKPNNRYFTITYHFSITSLLQSEYSGGTDAFNKHYEEVGIDDSRLGDEALDEVVAFEKLQEVDHQEARKILERLVATDIHTDCRIQDSYKSDPSDENSEKEVWDGVDVSGLLYPYEDTFGPRNYEEVAQEVISVGSQVDSEMSKLDIMEDISFDSVSNIR